jgi:hypothetical protein
VYNSVDNLKFSLKVRAFGWGKLSTYTPELKEGLAPTSETALKPASTPDFRAF